MALAGRTKCALLLGVSVVVLGTFSAQVAFAQTAETVQPAKPKPKKKRVAAPQAVFPEPVRNANAQVGRQTTQSLDEITVTASKTQERAIDALAPVSVVTLQQIQGRQASTVGDLIYNMPGVWLQDRGDEPSTSINIRGLQDFGRVAVVVDGARQNYQRTGHFANGSFYLNPELIGGIDITRGPTANIYGSGAIGGVASFRTKDIQDVLRPGEVWGVDVNTVFGSNTARSMNSAFGGVRINPNVDFFAGGTYSTQENYRDGSGVEVSNTWNRLSSGLAKLTIRPADGHEVKLGTVIQQDIYNVGQPARRAGLPNSAGGAIGTGTSVFATNVKNYMTTLGWTYSQPDDKLFDWDAKVYWNRTENNQVKVSHNGTTALGNCVGVGLGNNITGCVGDQRGYEIDTFGFDVHNTSRFEFGDWRHALTYGADGFRDEVKTSDSHGNSNITTPGGERTVTGGFVQWKANYTSLLEVVGALRYDNYTLSSVLGSTSGDRLSPKITVGLLPTGVITPYVSYAEGYRAPSITESLISGAHVATSTGAGDFNRCADGTRGYFCFIPNTALRPEVGKNKEFGLNIKKDSLFVAGDTFRGKVNVFRNDIEDYINPTLFTGAPFNSFPPVPGLFPTTYYQYQNIPNARIQGVEVETMYDASAYFVGVSASFQEGKNTQTNVGLLTIPSQKVTTTAGVRLFENTVTLSMMWTSVKANTDLPAGSIAATSYDLVNLYVAAKPTPNLTVTGSIENLLNSYYRPYAVPGPDLGSGLAQNDVLWASAGAGIVFKGGLKYHFGG
ncbi:TonB-dependent hemoglobin/transferrin/lactoferrin family receptor [Tardiphaga sp.]|jgi:hemoglobin/transferrin/lactoferrin receptor protein|uniref:TonB-dependent hemoglobin/transferrin/lactoferrin family receptor n=1 Tax=Tardiphaga sp. TaxID=1926292 RepID=UPI0037D996C9